MSNKSIKIVAITSVLLLILSGFMLPLADVSSSSGGESEHSILFDYGNGKAEWSGVQFADKSLDTIIDKSASNKGIDYKYESGSVTIDGIKDSVIGSGSTGASFVKPGSTGVKVTAQWNLYKWNESTSVWDKLELGALSETYIPGDYALGFYPEDVKPIETPIHKNAWVMIRGDAEQTGQQDASFSNGNPAEVKWTDVRGGQSGVYAAVLYAQGHVFVKFGTGSGMSSGNGEAVLKCYSENGDEKWEFTYPGIAFYETSTPVLVGDYIYFGIGLGYILKMPWKEGPGENNENVSTFNNAPYDEKKVSSKTGAIPYDTGIDYTGSSYSTGSGSLVYDSGVIYSQCSNGMVYCFDMDLKLIWSSQMNGHIYYTSPTIVDDYVFTGALDGTLYVMNKRTGEQIVSEKVYTRDLYGTEYGSVSAPTVIKEGSDYTIFMGISDGRGMSSTVGGISIYSFDGTELTKIMTDTTNFGMVTNYLQKFESGDFKGVIFPSSKGLFKVDSTGSYSIINSELAEIHAPPVLVNNELLYLASYTAGKPNYILNTDGDILRLMDPPTEVSNFNMSPITVIGDMLFVGNDSGMYSIVGLLPEFVSPVAGTSEALIVFAIIVAIVVLLYCVLRFGLKIEHPFRKGWEKGVMYIRGEDLTHNTKNRHRLLITLVIGILAVFGVMLISLCFGSTSSLSLGEMFSALFSAIGKGGVGMTYEETVVYSSRLPRTLVALAVGIGLSIAGSMYQAIIRNPLVDPYIMGVSAGAGTAAIAVIAFDFTFFGLFSSHSLYLIAFSAIVGGVIAFLCTMIIAEKAGGTSINYVLSGVIVGLAFSAVQTLMMSMAGNKVTNVLSWLFGSFSNISWNEVSVVFIPIIVLSLIPLIWAKEFNLVLLGEDQAKQMGLNVRWFNRGMLIFASVLTAICVAFVGIIGFVGLVVPHLCRMVLGGDHRMVLPASIIVGSILMMLADFASRMLFIGQELPVGAITTIIGVPMFAYLLISRGRMYDG